MAMPTRASVKNNGFDAGHPQDANLRVHVGEGVTSFLWTDVAFFYSARRFLGEVWYERASGTPCASVSGVPSSVPTGQSTTASRADDFRRAHGGSHEDDLAVGMHTSLWTLVAEGSLLGSDGGEP